MIFQSIVARGLSPDDIWYTAAASSWVTVVLNMLGLGNGMTHVVTNGAFEICSFLRDIEQRRVTAVMLVPTLIHRALEELAKSPYDLSSMRLLMYGSAPASPSLIEATYKAFGCEMIQSYGMTEAGWTTQLGAADHRLAIAKEPSLLRSVGRPGVMSEIEIRDEEGHVLPPVSQGNVWIRSETLMKGYLNLPEETAQALNGGWLCTNDVGYIDGRGYLFLTDRRKFMIISGAVNIFPSSVENALLEHNEVVEAAVVGALHPQWGEAVVAVVRLRQLGTVQAAELHAHCEQRLNSIERPKHILFVEDFPRSFNGKVQKQQVKEWVAAQQQAMPWNVSHQQARFLGK
jgi:acyl-CoA synthetase (AMP-forming)/AMP-acid ligase II